MDLKDIKAIIDLMKKNSLSEFELEKEDFKIKLKRGGRAVSGAEMPEYLPMVPVQTAPFPAAGPISTAGGSGTSSGETDIKSPMIGTFYRAPSPDAASYVEIGTEVGPDTVVCIIEAMKVMNEIKAEARGIVTQVLVENGRPVEFGQALFKIKPL